MRKAVLYLLAILLLGCAPRGSFVDLPDGTGAVTTRPVFVASVRPGRDKYSRIDVSIPAARAPGEVRYARGPGDPERDFLVAGRAVFPSAPKFRGAVSGALGQIPRNLREVVVYVHGFNTTAAEGTLRMAQLAHDLDLPGVAVHYSWPSAANPLGYAHDRDMALWSRDGLRALIGDLNSVGARGVILLAHSMGAQLVMETLRDMELQEPGRAARLVDAVVLISPDVDVSLFRAQAAMIRNLPQPFAVVTSSRDRALRLSARLTGQSTRLGNLDDPSALSDLDIVLLDVTAFSRGVGHFTAGSSPGVLRLLSGSRRVGEMLGDDVSGRTGLLPGTVLSVRNVTQIILAPAPP